MGCCHTTSDLKIAEEIISEREDTLSPLDVSQRGDRKLPPSTQLQLEQIPSFSTADDVQTAESIDAQYPIDLHLFQRRSINDECHREMDRECESLQRIKAMLCYHGRVTVGQFINFSDSFYPKQALLADYIHFVDRHSDRLSMQCIADDVLDKMYCVDLTL